MKHEAGGASTGGEGPDEGGQHGPRGGRARKDQAGKDWARGSSTSALCTGFTLVI
jgi:hypothetical protein